MTLKKGKNLMGKNTLILLTLTLLMVLTTRGTFATDNQGKCQQKANTWQQNMHKLLLEDIGPIPGVWQETHVKINTEVHDLDNLTETYRFSVFAGTSGLDSWIWEYEVTIEVWLAAGGDPKYCDVISAKYLGTF
jgi:maltose-binding protein MalE